MRFFEKTISHLPKSISLESLNYNSSEIESILRIEKCSSEIISDYKIENSIYQFHKSINYFELYDKRRDNHYFFKKNYKKNNNILEAEYEINKFGFLFFADTKNRMISFSQSEISKAYAYLAFYSFIEDWGYKLFILKNYDFVLVEILKNKANFTGIELKEALKDVLTEKNEREINTLCIELLCKFTLTFNGINIVG